MARGINKVILVGNLGQDPETRYMPSGKAVTNLRLATSDSWKDKQTGEQREQTEWHSVVMYDRLAEIAAEFLPPGFMNVVCSRGGDRAGAEPRGEPRTAPTQERAAQPAAAGEFDDDIPF